MTPGYFVTGTDTGVGKTLITAALVHGFARRGLAVAGLKPVAAGCRKIEGELLSEDVEMLRQASNVALPLSVQNPYAFLPALAPHIAAQQAGVVIDLAVIRQRFDEARRLAEALVVEGVGGFMVPLNDTEGMADVAVMLALPVVLVVGMRLGCLNHALLTAEAIRSRGLHLAGWVANCVDPGMAAREENLAALAARMKAPLLATLPFMPIPDYVAVSGSMEAPLIFP